MITPEEFKEEVKEWAVHIGVKYKEAHVQSMKRKWASCSSRGRLTFDPSILERPSEFRAEVIVHELLHLKFPNHGKMFKSLARTHLENGMLP